MYGGHHWQNWSHHQCMHAYTHNIIPTAVMDINSCMNIDSSYMNVSVLYSYKG